MYENHTKGRFKMDDRNTKFVQIILLKIKLMNKIMIHLST